MPRVRCCTERSRVALWSAFSMSKGSAFRTVGVAKSFVELCRYTGSVSDRGM